MAIMIPAKLENDNPGEKLVFDALREMPDTEKWVVRSNLRCSLVRISQQSNSKYLDEVESDFVVLIPEKGLVFLEVKSSYGFSCSRSGSCPQSESIEYRCKDGQWFRHSSMGDVRETRNPFEQVWTAKNKQMTALWSEINHSNGEDYKESFPGVYAHLVVYPQGKILSRNRIPLQAPCLVVTSKDMPDIKRKILDVVKLYPQARPLPKDIFRKIVEYFKAEVHIAPVKTDPATLETEIAKLTEKQKAAARKLLDSKNCRVIGCCGSGKTMLAVWLLKYKAQHHHVLFLCYNRMLAASLCIKTEERYEIKTINQLISSLANSARVPYDPNDLDGTFTDAVLNLDNAGELPQYDVIIIDEAQDISDAQFDCLEYLKTQTCSMYVFADPQQNMYQNNDRRRTPEVPAYARWEADEIILDKNCRNTKRIAKYVRNVGNVETSVFEDAPEGSDPDILHVRPNPFGLLSKTVDNLLNNQDYPWPVSSIAILVSAKDGLNELEDKTFHNDTGTAVYHSENSSVDALKELLRTWYSGRKILVSTIQAFKGMEADIVILYKYNAGFDNNVTNTYVGVSRPRGALFIIPQDPRSSEFVRRYLPREGEMG